MNKNYKINTLQRSIINYIRFNEGVSLDSIIEHLSPVTEDAIEKALSELVDNGYLIIDNGYIISI